MEYEPYQIQIGPELWRKFLKVIPKGISIKEIYMNLVLQNPDKIHEIINYVIENPEKARDIIMKIVNDEE